MDTMYEILWYRQHEDKTYLLASGMEYQSIITVLHLIPSRSLVYFEGENEP